MGCLHKMRGYKKWYKQIPASSKTKAGGGGVMPHIPNDVYLNETPLLISGRFSFFQLETDSSQRSLLTSVTADGKRASFTRVLPA